MEPHPNLPILATSGLDDDVKIWLPTSNKETSFEDIEKVGYMNEMTNTTNAMSTKYQHVE